MDENSGATTNLKAEDIRELISFFEKNTYKTTEHDEKAESILKTCIDLFSLDYKCITVDNTNGELCGSYPRLLIIPKSEIMPDEIGSEIDPEAQYSNGSTDCVDGSNGSYNDVLPTIRTSNICPLNLSSPSTNGHFNGTMSFSQIVARSETNSPSNTTSCSPSTARKNSLPNTKVSSNSDITTGSQLRDLMSKARVARCRARFPVPAILYNGIYVCRSSTLSGGVEMYGRSVLSNPMRGEDDQKEASSIGNIPLPNDRQLFDKVRALDIQLLKAYRATNIVDLMVEKKKWKYGFNVTSSEKVDKENRYNEFNIMSLPYPGCEFFKEFRDHNYNAEGLIFNWNQSFVDAIFSVPETSVSCNIVSDWKNYRRWDLNKLTQNYMKLLLAYIHESSNTGMLVHCISGWDRTPLFISLIRISLWADGAIHSSLDAIQMLYLTIAYDWYLFGHDLKDRNSKGEEIFFFCFYFIKYMLSEDYGNNVRRRHISSDSFASEANDSLSSAGSSNSLNSTSGRSSQYTGNPSHLKVGQGVSDYDLNVNHNWPYGSFPDNDFDFPTNRHSHTSPPSGRGAWGRSSLRDGDRKSSRSRSHRNSDSPVNISPNVKSNSSYNKHSPNTSWRTNGHSESSSESFGSLSDGGSTVGSAVGSEANNGTSSSPVAVPSSRNRKDSNNSIGSWQLVSGAGSLKGSAGSFFAGGSSINSKTSRCSGNDMIDSTNTIKEETSAQEFSSSVESDKSILVFNREKRLKKIRTLFHNQYCSALGLNFSSRGEGWGNALMSFVERVSLSTNS